MNDKQAYIGRLIELIDDFDTFGKQGRKMSLFSVAIGTLRKDRALAADILRITTADSSGLGALAVSRILIEDYLHLQLLDSDPAELPRRLDDFNNHPHIDHYWAVQAMKEWGFEFEDSKAANDTLAQVSAAFELHGEKFLRKGHGKGPYNADDYYRTWTKLGLNDLITKSGIPAETSDKKTLRFMTETYNQGSSIIHHNAFIIWFLASQGSGIFSAAYPNLALEISFIVLNRTINLVLKISRDEPGASEKYLDEQLRLESIMAEFAAM